MKPETLFRKKVVKFLDTLPNCWHESIQQQAIRGTPDILCCIKGVFVALELKAHDKAKVSDLQRHKLEKIIANGGYAYLVNPENFDDVQCNLLILNIGGKPDGKTNLCPLDKSKLWINAEQTLCYFPTH